MYHRKFTQYEQIISKLYYAYIEWVARTSQIVIDPQIHQLKQQEAILGFWHGDSLGMNFLLRTLQGGEVTPHVIVTADKRGNYIELLIRRYGGDVYRMPDGMAMRSFLRALKDGARQPKQTLCVALDGPLGPYHEPKKLGAMLSCEGSKPYVLIKVSYKRKLHLTKRWDHYVIPLPFGKMTFEAYDLGTMGNAQLRDFEIYKKVIMEKMCEKE
ncbi:MAG: hypothetical protein ACRCW2_06050 [Cellulosilyticaceae bacterium]